MALCAFGISRLPLFFQEQIKGSKNAPIARFDGLCCYQTRSKKILLRLARRAAFQKPRRKAKAKAKASVTPESASWGVLSIRRAIRQSLPDGGRQEVASRLVVTRGDGPVLLALGKEVLDLMASQAMPARQR